MVLLEIGTAEWTIYPNCPMPLFYRGEVDLPTWLEVGGEVEGAVEQ